MTRKDFLRMQIKQMLDSDLYTLVDTYASLTRDDCEYDDFCEDAFIQDEETEAMEIAIEDILRSLDATSRV